MPKRPKDMPPELNYKGEPRQRKERVYPDLQELEKIAQFHHTMPELAKYFGCSPDVLSREPYKTAINNGRNLTNTRLKQKAMARALMENSDTMLIFCLKNYCGWSNNDKVVVEKYDAPKEVGYKIEIIDNRQQTTEDDEQG